MSLDTRVVTTLEGAKDMSELYRKHNTAPKTSTMQDPAPLYICAVPFLLLSQLHQSMSHHTSLQGCTLQDLSTVQRKVFGLRILHTVSMNLKKLAHADTKITSRRCENRLLFTLALACTKVICKLIRYHL